MFAREGWDYNIASQPYEVYDILGGSKVDLVIIDMQGGKELRLAFSLLRYTINVSFYMTLTLIQVWIFINTHR
jgi:hypothetical protein